MTDKTGYRILITFLVSILNDSGSGRERDFFDGTNDADDDVCKCSEDVDVEEDDVWLTDFLLRHMELVGVKRKALFLFSTLHIPCIT